MKYQVRAVRVSSILLSSLVAVGLLLPGLATFVTPVQALAADSINLWWPTNGSRLSGIQPFKAMIQNVDVSQYDMYWRVDGGNWVSMYNSYQDYQHKEAIVDVSGWKWRGSGPYVLEFSAKKSGVEFAKTTSTIYIDNGLPVSNPAPVAAPSQPVSAPAPTSAPQTPSLPLPQATPSSALASTLATTAVVTTSPVASSPSSANTNPLSGLSFYVNPNSAAARQASVLSSSNPDGASALRTLASAPTAAWFGEWNTDVKKDAATLVADAQTKGQVPVIVAYDIPQRDCGGFSSGGNNTPDGYKSWIQSLTSGIGGGKAVVILEPDSLAQIGCLSAADQSTRLSLLSYAVTTLKKNAGTKVYIDAGHSGWIDPSVMADRLTRSNVAAADGFSLNVSNFMPVTDETKYGSDVSAKLGGKHFVIDTSRNGNGSNGQWCNPSGRAIGPRPSTSTGNSLVDAYLWIKVPGESDGYCNGGPAAGTWWNEYALSLVQNAR